MAVYILEDHNGRVYHHSNGKGKSRQTDDVDVAAEKGHHQEGAHHAYGNGGGDDQGTIDGSQKEDEHQYCQSSSHKEVLAHKVNRTFDILGFVINLAQPQPPLFEYPCVHLDDCLTDSLHYLKDVCSRLTFSVNSDGRAVLFMNCGSGLCVAEPDFGNVTDIDGGTIDVLDDDIFHIIWRLVLPHRSSNELTLTLVKISGTYVFIFLVQGGRDFGYGNVVGRESVGIEDDLQLWLDAPVDFGLSHTRNPFKPRLDEVLDELVLGFYAGVVTAEPFKDNPGDSVLLAAGGDQYRFLSLVRIFRHLVEIV